METPRTLADHDPVLRRATATHRSSTPQRLVLAVACRGVDAEIPPGIIAAWLRSRCPGPVADIANNRALFMRLHGAAERHVRRLSSLDGRAKKRARAARALVVYSLTPMPASVKMKADAETHARAALAAVGPQFLHHMTHNGYDTIVAPAPHLGVDLGVSRSTAGRALAACVQAGWLKRVSNKEGSCNRYRLRTKLPQRLKEKALDHSDLIDALLDDEPHPWRTVYRLVSHPALTFASDGAPGSPDAWLAALLAEADVDPATLRLPAKRSRDGLAEWLDLLDRVGTTDDDLPAALDAWAEQTGAAARHAVADAARREATAASHANRRETAERREQVREHLDRVLAAASPPQYAAPVGHKKEWRTAFEKVVAADPIPVGSHRDFERALAARLAKGHGYPEEKASRIASRLVAEPVAA